MKKSLIWVVLVAFSLLFVAACGGGGGGSTAATTPSGVIAVVSSSTHTVDTLQATPSTSSKWDYVYSTTLAPLGSQDLPLPPNNYNFCAAAGLYWACTWNFGLASGATVTITVHDADFGGDLEMVNNTGVQITEFYCRPHGSTPWGTNILGSSPISIGGALGLSLTAGTWDFRVVYSSSNHDYTSGTAISSLVTSTLNVL
jgi:hypothetical protein